MAESIDAMEEAFSSLSSSDIIGWYVSTVKQMQLYYCLGTIFLQGLSGCVIVT